MDPIPLSSFPFDPSAWNYANGLAGLARIDPTFPALLASSGGKAVGLTLCDRIATQDSLFHVPTWRRAIIPATEDGSIPISDLLLDVGFFLRSSEEGEDWLSEESGKFDTFRHRPGETLILCPPTRATRFLSQAEAVGVGCVIDIGWSPLAEAIVVRITTGRVLAPEEVHGTYPRASFLTDGRIATSATDDSDGLCGVWDARTGECIAWHPGDSLTAQRLERIPFQNIATRLYRATARAGITFGAQIEAVMHPTFDRVELVQLRPSPGAIRRRRDRITPYLEGRVFATTGSTSGACDVTAPVVFVDGQLDEHPPELLAGKIVAWGTLGHGNPLTPERHVNILEFLKQSGAGGFVAWRSLEMNTQHSLATPTVPTVAAALERLRTCVPSMRLTNLPLADIMLDGFPTPRARMVSDGLMGYLCLAR